MSDRGGGPVPGEGPAGGSGDPPPDKGGRGTTSRRNASWTFLPIGVPFLVLGLALGLGKGAGLPFFIIGLAFVTIGLAGGERDAGKKGSTAPPPPQEPPSAE